MDKTIALYMRLSDEDDNLAAHEESNSISHQRKLMLDHIQKLPELNDCNIMEFSDDGYSGADFSRPNFVKMMDLVKYPHEIPENIQKVQDKIQPYRQKRGLRGH